MYPEKFYVHSFQHLQENMDLIMNQTSTTPKVRTENDLELNTTNSGGENGRDGIQRSDRNCQEGDKRGNFKEVLEIGNNALHAIICSYYVILKESKPGNRILRRNKKSINPKNGSTIMPAATTLISETESLKTHLRNTNMEVRGRQTFTNNTSTIVKNLYKRSHNLYNNSKKLKIKRNSSCYNERYSRVLGNMTKLKVKYPRRFLNVSDQHLKVNILKDLHVKDVYNLNKYDVCGKRENRSPASRKLVRTKSTRFEPAIVSHIKQALLYAQQRERKKEPDAELACILKYNSKAHLALTISEQQKKLASLERFLERENPDIYRYVVVNDTIVNETSPWTTVYTTRPYRTLPPCFITEPRRPPGYYKNPGYTTRYFSKYLNNSKYWKINYTSTFYVNRNLYKNFNYSAIKYGNILEHYWRRANSSTKAQTNHMETHYTNGNVQRNFNNPDIKQENIIQADYMKAKLETQGKFDGNNITFKSLNRRRRRVELCVKDVPFNSVESMDDGVGATQSLPFERVDNNIMFSFRPGEI